MQEYEAWIGSEKDPAMESAQNVKKWVDLCEEASVRFGKRLSAAGDQKEYMINAGFIDVHDEVYKVGQRRSCP